MFTNGQKVVVNWATTASSRQTVVIPATFLRHVGKKLLCEDDSGKRFKADKGNVFASLEALEASIPNLRVSANAATGRTTEFPPDPRLRQDGETLWQDRTPGEASVFSNLVPDWMLLPKEVLAVSPGPAKRRIVRQFTHPCPKSGKPVQTRELDGGIFCFESPGEGWVFTNRLESQASGRD
jgi:hypothetical protein